jgi:serine/threonine protein phosphatase PrpC
MQIDSACLSKPGGRKANQDACGYKINDTGGCWIVADGLGGHAGGAIASRVAVDMVLSLFEEGQGSSVKFVSDCFWQVQQAIRNKATEDASLSEMRTTMVILTNDQVGAVWGHVGDSRLYWFRQGRIVHQTRDHSVPQMLVDAGKISFQDIRGHEDQNRLTRALGHDGEVHPSILTTKISIQEGDAALLCSDGIWTYVLEAEMEADLSSAHSAVEWLNCLEKRVLDRAEGPYDNYTAVAVLFQGAINT